MLGERFDVWEWAAGKVCIELIVGWAGKVGEEIFGV